MTFHEFISNLRNFEKTRNANVFNNYTLEPFLKICNTLLPPFVNHSVIISIIGTNGKGSVAHFLSEIGKQCEFFHHIGLYTSPHLLEERERIRIDSTPILEKELDTILNRFSEDEKKQLSTLTFFEIFTFFSIAAFRNTSCGLQIYEAGLGGRLDATKAVHPEIIILTAIGLDHCSILGDTEEKILKEKLAIANDQTKHVFSLVQKNKKLNEIIENFCTANRLTLSFYQENEGEDYLQHLYGFATFIMQSIFHRYNIECTIDPSKISYPPGRLERISSSPLTIYDTAHNPAAVSSLLTSIQAIYPNAKWRALFACLEDKDIDSMLAIMGASNIIQEIFLVQDQGFAKPTLDIKMTPVLLKDIAEIKSRTEETGLLVFGSFRIYRYIKN